MADLKLTSLRRELEQKNAPFTIEFETDGKLREVGFHHLLAVDKATRIKFYELWNAKFSEEEIAETGDVYSALVPRIRELMRTIATNKNEFRGLAAAVGEDFALWNAILENYNTHYQVVPGE